MNTFICQQGRKTDRETDVHSEGLKLQLIINIRTKTHYISEISHYISETVHDRDIVTVGG